MAAMLALALLFVAGITVTTAADGSSKDVMDPLLDRYDRSVVPKLDSGKALPVQIGIYVNNIYGVSSKDMEFSIAFYIRQKWQDNRLQFSEAEAGESDLRLPDGYWDMIWTPDLSFRNEKDAHTVNILSDQRLLQVNATGRVWYVTKYTATFSCPMKLHKFPFDTQRCRIPFETFGTPLTKLTFKWLDKHPADFDKDLQLPEFTLVDVDLLDITPNYTTGDSFTCLEVALVLDRHTGYYVMMVFIPSALLVVLSWLQFFLDRSAMTSRVLVGLFCTFTLVAQMTGLRSTLPEVSYVTSLDVWMFVCLLFTVSSLAQLGAVQMFGTKDEDSGEEKSKKKISRIDFISRIAFPALFLFFCVIYFAAYAS